MTITSHDDRMRGRLSHLAGLATQWSRLLDQVSADCTCELETKPGYGLTNNVLCLARRHCLAMTVLTIRTSMGINRVHTKHLASSQIPGLVDDLTALLQDLPGTTDWLTLATRLRDLIATGADSARHAPAPPTQPKGTTQP